MILTRLIQISLGLAALAMVGLFTMATAQDATEAEERSAFVEFVERIISTPDRQIRLGTISGALSSNVHFSEITIADRDGVWLRIEDVHLVWSRLALLRGRLEIDNLEAASIHVERRPRPPEEEIPEEAQLSIPELPVATNIENLSVPSVTFGEGVFGLASELSVEGRLRLADGDLDTALDIVRLDGPGGELRLAAEFDSDAETLDLDLRLSEPEDGVMANLLDLQGRPALDLTLAGSGPLDDFTADIALIADGEELLSGSTEISRVAVGYRFVAEVDGRLGELAPPEYSDLFGDASTLVIDAIRADDGAVSVRRADLHSGAMALTASAELAADWFPLSFALDAQLGTDSDDFVTLPFAGGITVRSAHITADVGHTDEEGWTARFDMQDMISGTVSAERALVTAGGIARNRADPENREVTFDLSGTAEGLSSSDAAIAAALGSSLELEARGDWSHGAPIVVETARVSLDHAEATFAGQVVDDRIDGEYRFAVDDLAPFSGVAGAELGGTAELQATGFVGTDGRSFALTLDGTADDIQLGVDAFDALFAGRTTLSGDVARAEDGLRFDELVLDQQNIRARVDGTFADDEVDLTVEAELPDIAVVTDGRASGAARLDVAVAGVAAMPTIDAALTGEDLVLIGRPFTDARAGFVGTVEGRDVTGDITLSGVLDGVAIEGASRLIGREALYTLEDLTLSAGETALTGDLTVRADTLMEGALRLESPDLSVIAPLLLTEMTGAVSAELDLAVTDDAQDGHLRAEVRGLRVGDFVLGSADIDVSGENLRSAPILAGEIEAAGIVAGPIEIETLSATAERVGDQTEFSATAELTEGVVTTTGRLVPDNGGLDIEFDTFELREAAINAILAEPTVISLREGAVMIPSARLNIDGGHVVLAGEVGDRVDLTAEIAGLNLAVANAFAPGLGLTGTVSGTLTATGPRAAPRGSFALRGEGLSAAALREVGVGPLVFEAQGQIADGDIMLDAAASGGGISMTASGTVPLTGPGLDVAVSGSLPLGLTDFVLAERGASLRGTLNVDARVTGSLAEPSFAGTLAADGATFVDGETGITLSDITLRAGLTAQQAVIETLTARSIGGGTLSVSGSVGIAPGAGFPADLAITLAGFRYQDGRLITATVDGALTLTGSLVGELVLGGTIEVARAEITIPENLPAGATMLDVEHRAPPPAVAETLRRARIDERRARDRATGLILDVTINAPARIFVRGRGIDAEFGGSLTLTGPATDIQPIGSFEMRRGHIGILGQRIVFTTGTITLVGDLDPMLNIAAITSTRHISITAAVTGRASDPDIALTSVPELPQDEVLAHLLFGRSLSDLSAFQIAQLAAAAAALAGATDGTGLLGGLRGATGLDELDVVAGQEGGVAVQAGRYIAENVYLGIRAGAAEDTRATINLDITDNFTARGEVGADGRSRVGVFFEREY